MTDEGLVGIGETGVYELTPEERVQLEARVQSYVGQDPLALEPFEQPDPFPCALLDIAGKASGVPSTSSSTGRLTQGEIGG